MTMTSVYAPITKSYEQDDGSVLVEGIITDSNLDLDQQRCDPAWLKTAVPAWMTFGNLREQHDSHRAIGKAIEHQDLGDAGHFIRGRVYDPVAVAKVKGGVFNGFSIGVKDYHLSKSADAPNGVIDQGRICEVSLVDYPCNENCRLTMVKAAKPGMSMKASDFDSERMLVRVEELTEKTVAPDLHKTAESEMTVRLSDSLSPEQAERLRSLAEPDAEKGTDPAAEHDSSQDVTPSFDAAAAKALVVAVLAKAAGDDMPPPYDMEQGDIENAQAAIGIIAKLIISEAQEMCDNPAEDCDIQLLMEAVQALRCFQHREQQQAMGADVVNKPVLVLTTEPDAEKAKYTADQKRQMLKEGKAMRGPGGEPDYPIGDKQDLHDAILAVGRGSGDHNAIRAYIKRRASALGASSMIPDNWTSSGSNTGSGKTVEPEMEKSVEVEETEFLEKAADGGIEDVENEDVEKTAEPEAVKTVESDGDVLVKALFAALEKADSPLMKSFEAIIEKSMAATAGQLGELSERLCRIEEMPLPGGPSLRRTEIEAKTAEKSDLLRQAALWRIKSENALDKDLVKGYAATAAEFLAKAESVGV